MYFIMSGSYKVGYEMNKKQFMPRAFGESTTIGGFEIAFEKRFMFKYVARTYLNCYSIRKENFQKIMKQFPAFKYPIRNKLWTFYSQ